jgi:hypothetical protein
MIHGTNPFREGATTPQEIFRRIENSALPKVILLAIVQENWHH